jgi:hypothetical protein
LRPGPGGSAEPSFGRKLFIDAQASISVPSTEKCSLDSSLFPFGSASSAATKSRPPAGCGKMKVRGCKKAEAAFTFAVAAYNLIRMLTVLAPARA